LLQGVVVDENEQTAQGELDAIAIFKAQDRVIFEELKKERKDRLKQLRSENLTLRGRQSQETALFSDLRTGEVRKRIRIYVQVSKERNCVDMLSPAHVQVLREDVLRHIEAGVLALQDRHHAERQAAGERLPIDPRAYVSLKWPLHDLLEAELGVLSAEWQAARGPSLAVDNSDDPQARPANTSQRKRGPKPNYEEASRIAEIVARVAPDSDWRPKWEEICEALDVAEIPCPKSWRKGKTCRRWADQLERSLAVKVIDYRLDLALQAKAPSAGTFS
jgi:hypothetical protein